MSVDATLASVLKVTDANAVSPFQMTHGNLLAITLSWW